MTTLTATATAPTLSPADLKHLEQTRQRLSHLTTSLASLQAHILNSDPLPPWSSLHSHLLILLQPLSSLATHLSPSTSSPSSNPTTSTTQSTQIYPLPSFPAQQHEGLLGQLLRKKLEPGVEAWVEEGMGLGRREFLGQGGGGKEEGVEEVKALWEWAGMRANEEARGYEWGGGGGEDDEDEDGEDRGEGEEGKGKGEEEGEGRPPMPLEDVLRFVMRGVDGSGRR